MSGDQSRPVSRVSVVEALTQIRDLCDEVEQRYRDRIHHRVNTASIRAVLDAVSVDATPAQGLDRGRLHGLMCNVYAGATSPSAAVDAVLALVRPVEDPIGPWSGWTDWVPSAVSPFEFRWLRGTPQIETRPLAAGPEVS